MKNNGKGIVTAIICFLIVLFIMLLASFAANAAYEQDYFAQMILFAASGQTERLHEAEALRNEKIAKQRLPYPIITSEELLNNFEYYAGFSLHREHLEDMIHAAVNGDDEAGYAAEIARNRKIDILQMRAVKISYSDLKLLGKIITAEAGSAWLPMDWKMATGEVVLNRVASPEFPNTIQDVLDQPGQYYPKGSLYFINLKPFEDCVRAAAKLLNGERELNEPSVVFQANFPQGGGIFRQLTDSKLGSTYYCYTIHPELY